MQSEAAPRSLSLVTYGLLWFSVYDDFENLLQDQLSIESFIEWLDKIIDESIVKVCLHTFNNVGSQNVYK